MKRLNFWINIFTHYFRHGIPLSSMRLNKKFVLGLRNRGLLDYKTLDEYEPTLQSYISSIEFDSTFLDIGANVGLMSAIALENKNISQVIAVEPSESFNALKINAPNASLIKKALTDYEGNLELVYSKNAARDYIQPTTKDNSSSVEMISSTELLSLANSLAHGKDIVAKFDIEGGEDFINWSFWFENKQIKMYFIEVWNQKTFVKICDLAERNFERKIFNDRFDKEISAFESPCNLVFISRK